MLAAGFLPALALFLPQDVDASLQQRINEAVERGIESLRDAEDDLGSGTYATSYPGGTECLAFYALQMSGVSKDDPYLARLETLVTAAARSDDHTYTLALATVGLLARDRKKHAAMISDLVARLEAGQRPPGIAGAGGYGYTLPSGQLSGSTRDAAGDVAHWDVPAGWHDNSNTQYAVLALRSALDYGFAVKPATFRGAARYLLRQQTRDGGAGYGSTYRSRSYTAMTAGVFGALLMCVDALEREDEDDTTALREQARKAGARAGKWLAKNLRWPPEGSPWPYYAAYAVERFGHHSGEDAFGSHEWYEEGARWLLDLQLDDGSWSSEHVNPALPRPAGGRGGLIGKRSRMLRPQPKPSAGDPIATSFALLFLKRASFVHTRVSDEVTILLRGLDPQAPPAEIARVKKRILESGRYAVEQLVLGLAVDNGTAFGVADECLRSITGESMGYRDDLDAEGRRDVRRRWTVWLLAHPELRMPR